MTEYDTALSVNLTKPVSLVKRPRAGEAGSFENLFHILLHADRAPIDYVKYVGKHAAPYYPENEIYSLAACTPATPQEVCPQCDPLSYAGSGSKHAYQINMF